MASKVNFGVGVSNAFDLLDDETEETQSTSAQKGKETRKAAPAKGKVVETKKETPKEGARTQEGAPKSEAPKKGRKEQIVGEYSGQKQQAAAAPAEPEERDESRGFQKVESQGRNDQRRGSSRGGREGAGGRFKRQYDRRSGTGRGKEVSKGGAGKRNWGRNEENLEEAPQNATTEEQPQEPVVERELSPEEKAEKEKREKEAQEKREQEEKEANYKLLTEYLEEKKKKGPVIPLPAPRNPNEESTNQWKDFTPLKKNAPESSVPKSKEQKKDEKKEEKKEEKKDTPKEVRKKEKLPDELLGFQTAPRPAPERENRREGRGERRGQGKGNRGPRKSNQGGRGSEKAINLDEFPSLATKA